MKLWRALTTGLMAGMLASAAMGQTATVVRINCGGGPVPPWSRDQGFTSGQAYKSTATIKKAGTIPQKVYQSCRTGANFSYSFPEPDGFYDVKLHMAELQLNAVGSRVFSIKLEGILAAKNLDVFALTGGRNRGLRLAYRVAVKDGNGLQIQALRKKGAYPILSGIEINPVTPAEDLVLIPGGNNTGTNRLGRNGDFPATYSLSVGSFFLSRTEVSYEKWALVRSWALTNGYTDLAEGYATASNHPVEVDYDNGAKWCNARSEMEGRIPAYYLDEAKTQVLRTGSGFTLPSNTVNWTAGYRLPKNDEWEYAARGGVSNTLFPWGDTLNYSRANYSSAEYVFYDEENNVPNFEYYGEKAPVNSFAPNGFGLHNVIGNGFEMCWETRLLTYPFEDPFLGCAVRGGESGAPAYLCFVGLRTYSDVTGPWCFRPLLPFSP